MAGVDWRCPPPTEGNEMERLAWLRSTRTTAQSWLASQPAYRDVSDAIRMILGVNDEIVPDEMSTINSGELRRCARELVASLSNLKVSSNFRSEVKDLYKRAGELNKLWRCWWYMTKPNRSVRAVLQKAVALGTGFTVQEWDPEFYRPGRGDVRLRVKGPHEVLPVQLPEDHDYQRAYAIHIIDEMSVHEAQRRFWAQKDKIVPDRQAPTWLQRGLDKVQRFLSPVFNIVGIGRGQLQPGAPVFPTVDVISTYVDDRSVNESGHPVQMGEPGTSWAYTVPSMGSEIPTGTYDKSTGQPLFRKATYEDCRLYPFKRLIQWTNQGILYDNTSKWIHGRYPIAKWSLDDWIFSAIGVPITRDTAGYDASMTRIMRAIDDSAVTRLDPPLQVNENAMDEDTAATFRVRQPGVTFRLTSLGGDAVKPALPYQQWDLPAYIPAWVQYLADRVRRITGVFDAEALAKARQMPSSDTMEKLQEMMGPLLNDMTAGMEVSMQEVADQWKGLVFQFRTFEDRLQLLGDDAETIEDFDYMPGSMIPSHMPWEAKLIEVNLPSAYSVYQRAREYSNLFSYQIVPGQMHQVTSMSKQLLLLQYQARGLPIDPWTMAEAAGLPNFGPPPEGTTTVMERYVAWKRMEMEMIVNLQKELSALGVQPPTAEQAMGGGKVGRPTTGMKPPRIAQKDGGTRSTITQSG